MKGIILIMLKYLKKIFSICLCLGAIYFLALSMIYSVAGNTSDFKPIILIVCGVMSAALEDILGWDNE